MDLEYQKTSIKEIVTCEVCGNIRLKPVLDLGEHPLCDDLVSLGDQRKCIEYPIEILYCAKCSTAHQRFQVPKQQLFPHSYHYRSRLTADVLNGMGGLVEACERHLGTSLAGKLIIDVGCNDGSLLDLFRKKGANTVGIEPTDAYRDGLQNGHVLFNEFFTEDIAEHIKEKHGFPDIITFTNVFAHIENFNALVNALKILTSKKTMIVIENHYLGSIINRNQFDTFYHEHPRTYSLTSFQFIASRLGVKLTHFEFPSRYGGNIRVFLGGPGIFSNKDLLAMQNVIAEESFFGERLRDMQYVINSWKFAMIDRLEKIVSRNGRLSAKAFPGRAAILIKLLGVDANTIKVVYEKPGSMKIGRYLPGTRIPIESDNDLLALPEKPAILLNLAWHISDEIKCYLRGLGFKGKIIDIFTPSWRA